METDYGSLGDEMKKLLALTEENNRMLKSMRRDKWIGFFLNILVWGVILWASYYFTMQLVQPLLSSFGGGSESFDIQGLLKQYQSQMGQ